MEAVNALMPGRGLEPVRLPRPRDGRVHHGGEGPAAISVEVKGDDLFVLAADEQEILLRPPAQDADRPVGLHPADLFAGGRQQMHGLPFGDTD